MSETSSKLSLFAIIIIISSSLGESTIEQNYSQYDKIDNGFIYKRLNDNVGDYHVKCDNQQQEFIVNSNRTNVYFNETVKYWMPIYGYLINNQQLCSKKCKYEQIVDATNMLISYNNKQIFFKLVNTQQLLLKQFENESLYIKCEQNYILNTNKQDSIYELKCTNSNSNRTILKCIPYCELYKSINTLILKQKQSQKGNKQYYLNNDYLKFNCTKNLLINLTCINRTWYLSDNNQLSNITNTHLTNLINLCLTNLNQQQKHQQRLINNDIEYNEGDDGDEHITNTNNHFHNNNNKSNDDNSNLLFQLNLRTFVIIIAISGILLLLLLLVSLLLTLFNKKRSSSSSPSNSQIIRTRTRSSITTTTNSIRSQFDILNAYRLRRSLNTATALNSNNDQLTFSIGSSSSLNNQNVYLPTYDEAIATVVSTATSAPPTTSQQQQPSIYKPYTSVNKHNNNNNNEHSSKHNSNNNKQQASNKSVSSTSSSRRHIYHHNRQSSTTNNHNSQRPRELDTQSSNSNNFTNILLNRSRSNSSRSTATTNTTNNIQQACSNAIISSHLNRSNETFGAISEACTIITHTSCNSNESNASKFVLRGSIDDNNDNLGSEMNCNNEIEPLLRSNEQPNECNTNTINYNQNSSNNNDK